MKLLLALALLLPGFVYAEALLRGSGKVAGAGVEMHLDTLESDSITGHYLYTRTQQPIQLRGQLDANELRLKTVGNSNIQETFIGSVQFSGGEISWLEGRWYGEHLKHGSHAQGYSFYINGRTGPLDDKAISCEEMRLYPQQVFVQQDLGSGHASPIKVDYDCPFSIAQLPFMQSLLAMAKTLRQGEEGLPWYCTGSLASAQWRYYMFDLAHLGYFPQSYANFPWDEKADEYFAQWSYQSPYTRAFYNQFHSEQKKATEQLTAWYQQQHSVSDEQANGYSSKVMQEISRWAFGSVGYYQQDAVVDGTGAAIGGNDRAFVQAFANAPATQQLNSLKRLIAHHVGADMVQVLLGSLKTAHYSQRSESALSSAVETPDVLQLLLEAGFDPNHQNSFGKTALYYAIEADEPVSVKKLLQAGAWINHGYQLPEGDDNQNHCFAIEQWQRTPLMHAAQHANVAMLELLLAKGADATLTDELGNTAYDYALKAEKADNAQYLSRVVSALN